VNTGTPRPAAIAAASRTSRLLPMPAPDARRRRLTTLINTAALASQDAAVYVIEDMHWIDEASESMLADFMSVIPRTQSLTLITYRPEYRGVLARVAGSQSITLRPLSDAQASSLTANLLGDDASIRELAALVRDRAAGNPFFVEEIVRDLSERGVLGGQPGAYELHSDMASVDVPATLQVTVGARVDRLEPKAKQTLNAAAVVGSRFDTELLTTLIDSPDVEPLIEAELVDQVRFTPGQVHRRRDHGHIRCAKGVRGPRRSCLSSGIRDSGGDEAACRRRPRPRRCGHRVARGT
jgi:adenylate cyclase